MSERTNEPRTANEQPIVRDLATTDPVAELRQTLSTTRAIQTVRDEHTIAVRTAQAERRTALANLDERTERERRSRRSRRRDANAGRSVEDLYRRAAERGTAAYVRSQITGSAEMRSLRLAAVRRTALIVGIAVLLAFAAWSTSNVQAGVVRILDHTTSTMQVASWLVEPAIIAIVSLIIIGQAVLRSSGGAQRYREADLIKTGALVTSLSLAIIGGWPAHSGWSGAITALPHGVGPIGCAITAYLISLFDRYVSEARPWDGAPKLADLDIIVAANIASTIGATRTTVIAANEPAGSEPAELRTANTEPSAIVASDTATETVIAPTEVLPAAAPRTNERTEIGEPRTNERTTSRANGRTITIDEQTINEIERRWPSWREELPPARDLAELLGYRSSSTGLKIRQRLVTIIEQTSNQE